MLRKLICFVIAGAMLAAGLYTLYFEAMLADVIRFRVIMFGAGIAIMGGIWLWADFGPELLRHLGWKNDPPR